MSLQIQSIFSEIATRINTITDLSKAKKELTEFVNNKKINDKDKKTITFNITEAKTIYQIQKYVYNSLLKYEGMGMNQINKTAREATIETTLA